MMPSALLVDTKSQALFLVLKVHCFFLLGWQSGISSLKWSVSISQTRTATDTQKLEDLVLLVVVNCLTDTLNGFWRGLVDSLHFCL
ncbi:unnamed protein product [Camellia sinensis]